MKTLPLRVGIVVLAVLGLAAIGVLQDWRRRRDVRLWLAVAAVDSLLTLGPVLKVAGRVATIGGVSLPMPYAVATRVPLLSWGRAPARLNLTARFALATLAAYGVCWVIGRVRGAAWRQIAALGVMALVVLDGLYVFPWPMADASVPDFYAALAADERSVAVLDLPVANYVADKYYLLYQMTHGHTIVGGYRTRRPFEAERAMRALEGLARPGGDPLALADRGIGYVILHRDFIEDSVLGAWVAYLHRPLEVRQ